MKTDDLTNQKLRQNHFNVDKSEKNTVRPREKETELEILRSKELD